MLTVHKSTGKQNSLVTLQLNLKEVSEINFFQKKFPCKFPCNSRNEDGREFPREAQLLPPN